MKRCHVCRRLKELDEFYLSKHTIDGYRRACIICERAAGREYQKQHPEKAAARQQRAKQEFVDAYGGKCYCCGEDELAFLSLDHVNGDGHHERATVGRGAQMYRRAKRLGWPKCYRVACMNCNTATARGRTCPHKIYENN